MPKEEKGEEVSCIVCGGRSDRTGLCERCQESLQLCEAENYVKRKMMIKNTHTEEQTLSDAGDL